ncbi:phage tail tape measure protein [Candidatus Falkowbacteria bacterium]|nr:MAG: phage tail tape measure protein [Candidatus Falkowbacteria bacterium]
MATVNINIQASAKGAQTALKNLQTTASKSVSKMEGVGRSLKNAFAGLKTQFLGIASAFLTFQGIKSAVVQLGEFSKALQEIRSIANDSVRTNQKLSSELIKTARVFGTAPTDQAKTFYQIISAGITDATKAQKTLIAANKLAIGGLSSTEASVNILTSALNVYAEENLDAEVAADALFTAVRLGKTRVDELASSLGKVLPIAKSVGLGFSDVSAAVAALTTKGLSTSEAVTALNSLLGALVKNQADIQKQGGAVAEAFDVQALGTKRFDDFIRDLNDSVDGNATKILKLVGRKEALLAVQSLASESTKVLTGNLDAMTKSAGAADRAFADVENSIGFQVDKIRNNLGNLVLTLTTKGEGPFADVLKAANKGLAETIDNVEKADFTPLLNSMKQVGKILLVVALVFEKLVDDQLKLVKGFLLITSSNKKMDDQAKKTIDTVGILKDSFAGAFLGIPGLIGSIADKYSRTKQRITGVAKENEKAADSVFTLDNAIKKMAKKNTLVGQLALSFIDVKKAVVETKKAAEDATITLTPKITGIDKFTQDVGNFLESGFSKIGDKLFGPLVKGFEETFKKLETGDLLGFADDVLGALGSIGKSVGSAIANGAKAFSTIFGGQFIDILGQGLQAVLGLPQQFVKALENFDKLFGELVEGISNAVQNLPKIFDKVFSNFIARLPQLARSVGDLFGVIAEKIAEAAPAIVDVLLQAVTALVQRLPDVVAKLLAGLGPAVKALLKGLPAVIDAVFDNLPSIVKMLADEIAPLMEIIAANIGPVAEALAKGIAAASGEIVAALIDSLLIEGGLERIVKALLAAVPAIAIALVRGLARGLSKAGTAIGQSIARGFLEGSVAIGKSMGSSFSSSIVIPPTSVLVSVKRPKWKISVKKIKALKLSFPKPDWLNSFESALKNFGGGGGGGGGGGALKKIGLAGGGVVPGGFPGDSFDAGLTSGELVTPPKTTDNLFKLIDGLADKINRQENAVAPHGGDQNLNLSINIGEAQLAEVLLNLNRQGFRVA